MFCDEDPTFCVESEPTPVLGPDEEDSDAASVGRDEGVSDAASGSCSSDAFVPDQNRLVEDQHDAACSDPADEGAVNEYLAPWLRTEVEDDSDAASARTTVASSRSNTDDSSAFGQDAFRPKISEPKRLCSEQLICELVKRFEGKPAHLPVNLCIEYHCKPVHS